MQLSEAQIAEELRRLHRRLPGLQERLEAVSFRFLGTPYVLGPLGEGPRGEFDRDPLVSFKAADCTTLVEQVMALSLEPELTEALKTLQRIRYRGGRVSYEDRNHFAAADWVPNNAAAGFIEDITREVAGEKTKTATKLISKSRWYAQKSTEALRGFDGDPPEARAARLERLRALGSRFADQRVSLDYLPVEILPAYLRRIPPGTIVNLVHEDKDDVPVLVSHQVLLLGQGDSRTIRHASPFGGVVDVPALEFFYKYFAWKWRLVGLNLNRLRDPRLPASPGRAKP